MSFNINDVVVDEAKVTLDFPQVKGGKITISRISADRLMEIREKSTIGKTLNPTTKMLEDNIDNEKFLKMYSDDVIDSWSGLKAKDLKNLMLCNIPKGKEEADVLPTKDNKYMLMNKSTLIDTFITDVLQSVSLFNDQYEEEQEKK